jgi:NAD+ kinase
MSPRTIGLIANTEKPDAAKVVPEVVAAFTRAGCEVNFDTETGVLAGGGCGLSRGELSRRSDVIVVLGGDGTLLEVVRDFGEEAPPVFGINLGSLGFLTSVGGQSWQEAVDCIAGGLYRVEERTLLRVELVRPESTKLAGYGLNDAVISRGELSRLIKLDVAVDGAWLSEYNADGLIVATPTGSTAYALSAGGPVLTPDSGVCVIAPICPHVLTMRAVIVAAQSTIEIRPKLDGPAVYLTIDGQEALPIGPQEWIRVTQAQHRLRLATLPGTNFFEVLRQKLKWSGTAV